MNTDMKTELLQEMVKQRTAFTDKECAAAEVDKFGPEFKAVIRGVLSAAYEAGFIAGVECESKQTSYNGPG